MGKNLKKFVNPKFTKTVDLSLLKRLFGRHESRFKNFDIAILDGEPAAARAALLNFFAGSEENYPEGLIADLHRIAELGNSNGLRLLQEQAQRRRVDLVPSGKDGDEIKHDPKQVALSAFLDQPTLFDAASDMLALEARVSLGEFAGAAEGIKAQIDDVRKAAFEEQAKRLFEADLRGRYCRIGWYDDGDEINVVVTHGAPVTTTPVVEGETERVISFRVAEHAVLAYSASTGRLKVGGIAKARRGEIAEIFAQTMLGNPGFFAAPDSQSLYTLTPIELAGFGFRFTHAFDASIRRVQIVEVQADRINTDPRTGEVRSYETFTARDHKDNALARLGEIAPAIAFRLDAYRIGHIVIRIHFDVGEKKPVRVAVKIRPPGIAMFKRHRFEAQIMELLRRNGLCNEREPSQTALAAE
jgi:hypothetical protein